MELRLFSLTAHLLKTIGLLISTMMSRKVPTCLREKQPVGVDEAYLSSRNPQEENPSGGYTVALVNMIIRSNPIIYSNLRKADVLTYPGSWRRKIYQYAGGPWVDKLCVLARERYERSFALMSSYQSTPPAKRKFCCYFPYCFPPSKQGLVNLIVNIVVNCLARSFFFFFFLRKKKR